MALALYYPNGFLEASTELYEEVCNGCGAKGGTKVPNTMWCLDVKLACEIHDWMFYFGKTKGDMLFANAMFLYNLCAIICNESNAFTVMFRLSRATKYFYAVVKWGDTAFYVDKKANSSNTITLKGKFKNL